MPPRDLVRLLEYEAKRKPKVKELYSRVLDLTEEEIDNADVPLPWYKKALKEVQRRNRVETNLAQFPLNHFSNGDMIGTTVVFTGQTNFYSKGHSNFEVEIKTNDWLFFPDTGGVYFTHIFFSIIPDEFLKNKELTKQTKDEYQVSWNEELERRY